MKKQQILKGFLTALAVCVLILDSKTALAGAEKGVTLCIQTVIPSLFPFFVLSILLTGTITGRSIPFLQPIGRLFGIPKGTESLLATGFLGGYPVGAQCVSQGYESGWLSNEDAQRMLVICNNCGPAFLFGMAGTVFDIWYVPWMLMGIQIISSLAIAMVLRNDSRSTHRGIVVKITFTEALDRALRVMASVCGWVILFRVVIAFLDGWFLWLLPLELQVITGGLLELSNGCFELLRLENMGLRFIFCAGMLSFGGLCVTLQTMAVTDPDLDHKLYLPGKVFGCSISLAAALLIQLFFPTSSRYCPRPLIWFFIGTLCIISGFILHKIKNSSSISEKVGV